MTPVFVGLFYRLYQAYTPCTTNDCLLVRASTKRFKILTGHIKPREGTVSLYGLHQVAALVVVHVGGPKAQGLEGAARVR